MRAILLSLLLAGAAVAAPAPLPRPVPRPRPVRLAEVAADWRYEMCETEGLLRLYGDGSLCDEWRGERWSGTWRLLPRDDGTADVCFDELSPAGSSFRWRVRLSRDRGCLIGDAYAFRRW